MTSYEEVSG